MAIDETDASKIRVATLGRSVDTAVGDPATLPTAFNPGPPAAQANVLAATIPDRIINRAINTAYTRLTNVQTTTEAFGSRFDNVIGAETAADQADFAALGGNLIHVVAGIVSGGVGPGGGNGHAMDEPPDNGMLHGRARAAGSTGGAWHTFGSVIDGAINTHDADSSAHDDIRQLIANLSTGTGGGAATWGVITGTLEDQADLKLVLDELRTGTIDGSRITSGSIHGSRIVGSGISGVMASGLSGDLVTDDAGFFLVCTTGSGLRRMTISGYYGSRIEGSLGYNVALDADDSSRSYNRFVMTSGRGIGHYWSNIPGSYVGSGIIGSNITVTPNVQNTDWDGSIYRGIVMAATGAGGGLAYRTGIPGSWVHASGLTGSEISGIIGSHVNVSEDVTTSDEGGTNYPQVIVTSGQYGGLKRRTGIPGSWVTVSGLSGHAGNWGFTIGGSQISGNITWPASVGGSIITGIIEDTGKNSTWVVVTSGDAGIQRRPMTDFAGGGGNLSTVSLANADSSPSSYPYFVVTSGIGLGHYKTYVEGSRVSGSLPYNVTIGGSQITSMYNYSTSSPPMAGNVCVTSGYGIIYCDTKSAGLVYERVYDGTGEYELDPNIDAEYVVTAYNTSYSPGFTPAFTFGAGDNSIEWLYVNAKHCPLSTHSGPANSKLYAGNGVLANTNKDPAPYYGSWLPGYSPNVKVVVVRGRVRVWRRRIFYVD